MKINAFLLLLIVSWNLSSQKKLEIFQGNLDFALQQSRIEKKNIFLITRSETCAFFHIFYKALTNDQEAIDYLNKEFIIYEYDIDKATRAENKRMKKYYHSWRGFPQLYFINENEKLISDIVFSELYTLSEQIVIWRNYKTIEKDWKEIKKVLKRDLTVGNLKQFLSYRVVKYSPYHMIQMPKLINKYFENLPQKSYSDTENWFLFQKHITIYSNFELFDSVVRNRSDFEQKNDSAVVSNYLAHNFYEYVINMSKEDRERSLNKYPFNTIVEAKNILENFISNKSIKPIIPLN